MRWNHPLNLETQQKWAGPFPRARTPQGAADTAEPALLQGARPKVRWERTALEHWLRARPDGGRGPCLSSATTDSAAQRLGNAVRDVGFLRKESSSLRGGRGPSPGLPGTAQRGALRKEEGGQPTARQRTAPEMTAPGRARPRLAPTEDIPRLAPGRQSPSDTHSGTSQAQSHLCL